MPGGIALLPLLLTALLPVPAHAGPVALSESDFSLGLGLYTEAGAWAELDTSNLAGVFGPHRCQCPEKIAPALQITSTGQTNIGNSSMSVAFYLGDNCYAAPASCMSLGQVAFSASQQASTPQFSSDAVFQAATGSASPTCTSLSADSTTLWALLTQDGKLLSFSLSLVLPISGTTVGAPTGVTAVPASEGLLVSWSPPADASRVAGYQVLCLPGPASAATAGYEKCGLVSSPGATVITPADQTQVCSAVLSSTARSIRVTGLIDGTTYSVAVIAIDASGGTSAPSSPAAAMPQPTVSFWDKYKQAGGDATGCSLIRWHGFPTGESLAEAIALLIVSILLYRRKRPNRVRQIAGLSVLLLTSAARAQDSGFEEPSLIDRNDSAFAETRAPVAGSPPAWGVQLGVSLYRPDVDSEFKDGSHPYADTFSRSRHLLSAAELDRYLYRRFGTLGIGLRAGYYRATAAAFLGDGVTRSGDETRLRLIPVSLSLLYFANGLPGLRNLPLIPYTKLGLDATVWTASSTGDSSSQSYVSLGWHATAGLMLGLGWLWSSPVNADDIAAPCSLFFEWSYAAINGLGLSHALHVGDNTWFAGIAFDI